MLEFVPTGVPLTYSVPVLPDSVTATCDQVFNGSVPGASIRCSAPPPPVVMAKRSGPPPALSVRNMLTVVPVPKSNTRDQALFCDGLTHAETVKSCSPLTMPSGSWTYSPFPDSLTALPTLPATRGPVAPVLVTAAMVRVSAAEPVPICTCWPAARPVELLTSTVVSPAPAGGGRPGPG